MKVLFIGGTGIISTASTHLALARGMELYLLNRGNRDVPAGAHSLVADINGDPAAVAKAIAGHSFDAIVNWVAFTPEQVQRDIELFRGKTSQYIFISSASAYQKPPTHFRIREDTPLCNPYWDYSRDKIAAEDALVHAHRETGFPVTIVRPSLTYGDTQIPLAVNSWNQPYTIIARMQQGKPLIVPGDGTSLWTITHNSDFAKGLVGLLGHPEASGHAFHITSDEVMTWNQYYSITTQAAGFEPNLIHIPSDFIAACIPGELGSLLGDKAVSTVFDNSKIKSFVPGFTATTRYDQGIRSTLAWFEADAARRSIDTDLDATWDHIISAYSTGLSAAKQHFSI